MLPFTTLIQDDRLRYVAFLLLLLVKGFAVIVGFPCTTILLTNSASSLRILGTLNGFATAFSGLGRAIGPATTGTVFTLGVKHGYIIAPWWLLAAVALVGAVPTWLIVESDGPSSTASTPLATDTDDEADEADDPLALALPPYRDHPEEEEADDDTEWDARDDGPDAYAISPRSLSPVKGEQPVRVKSPYGTNS